MPIVDTSARISSVQAEVEASPVYELLLSLYTLSSQPRGDLTQHREYLRGAIRQASPDFLDSINAFAAGFAKIWAHLLGLAREGPKEVLSFMATLENMSAQDVLLHLLGYHLRAQRGATPPEVIVRAARGDPEARRLFLESSFPEDSEWQAALDHLLSRPPGVIKRQLCDILRGWYESGFRPYEAGLLAVLERDAKAKRLLATGLSTAQLLEAVAGVGYAGEPGIRRIVLIPSLVLDPWVLVAEYQDTKFFCYPVAEESSADMDGPPALLVQVYKAVADENRLRILKMLASSPLPLADIAAGTGLAKSTAHHHLATLRAAGLVWVREGADKVYGLRERLPDLSALLHGYLGR